MENLLDFTNQDETQQVIDTSATAAETVEAALTIQTAAEVESVSSAVPDVIEEIDTAPKAQVATALPGKPVSYKREEPPPNPLLLDPYEWGVR